MKCTVEIVDTKWYAEVDGEEYSGTVILHEDERRADEIEWDFAPTEGVEEIESAILDAVYASLREEQ